MIRKSALNRISSINFAVGGAFALCGGCLVALVMGLEEVEASVKRGNAYYNMSVLMINGFLEIGL